MIFITAGLVDNQIAVGTLGHHVTAAKVKKRIKVCFCWIFLSNSVIELRCVHTILGCYQREGKSSPVIVIRVCGHNLTYGHESIFRNHTRTITVAGGGHLNGGPVINAVYSYGCR